MKFAFIVGFLRKSNGFITFYGLIILKTLNTVYCLIFIYLYLFMIIKIIHELSRDKVAHSLTSSVYVEVQLLKYAYCSKI